MQLHSKGTVYSIQLSKMKETIEGAGGGSQIVVVVVAVAMVSLTVVYLALLARKFRSHAGPRKQLPPGPQGWPVVGSLLALGKHPHSSLSAISKQYGPLMLVRFGSLKSVVVSNSHMAREMLKTCDLIMCSRPDLVFASYMSYNRNDIVFAEYGPKWRHLRKVGTQELLSVSRVKRFQGSREREVMEMLRFILEESQQGNAVDMSKTLRNLVTNVITQMMWNKSYFKITEGSLSVDEVEAATFRQAHHDLLDLAAKPSIADFIPILKPLIMYGRLGKRMKSLHERLDKFYDNIIAERQKKESPGTAVELKLDEDFVDVLLKKAESDEPVSIEGIKGIFTDILGGGIEPTVTVLKWAFTEMIKDPNIMKRAQDELKAVVGPDRLVNEADVPNLKFIQAVIKETFRMHPSIPMILRESRYDCEIAGYLIPARSLVFVSIWAIQRDPAVWERPLDFDPDRFLGSTVDVKGLDFNLIPFGSGRRVCPGVGLVLTLLEYSLAQLLHTFSWTLPDDQKAKDLTESFSIFRREAFRLSLIANPLLPAHVIYPTSQ